MFKTKKPTHLTEAGFYTKKYTLQLQPHRGLVVVVVVYILVETAIFKTNLFIIKI